MQACNYLYPITRCPSIEWLAFEAQLLHRSHWPMSICWIYISYVSPATESQVRIFFCPETEEDILDSETTLLPALVNCNVNPRAFCTAYGLKPMGN